MSLNGHSALAHENQFSFYERLDIVAIRIEPLSKPAG
jgi:hypothetical protein